MLTLDGDPCAMACCERRCVRAKCVLRPLNDQEHPSLDTSKVSSKWQVVIPRRVREAEQIRVGSEVMFERTAEGILLRPSAPESAWQRKRFTASSRPTGPGGNGRGYRACGARGGRA